MLRCEALVVKKKKTVQNFQDLLPEIQAPIFTTSKIADSRSVQT